MMIKPESVKKLAKRIDALEIMYRDFENRLRDRGKSVDDLLLFQELADDSIRIMRRQLDFLNSLALRTAKDIGRLEGMIRAIDERIGKIEGKIIAK